ncbi:Tobamovirus multiplication protein 1-like protein [Drosera capensis]
MGRFLPIKPWPASISFTQLLSDWWDEINDSTQWQDGIFFALCSAYGIVSLVALIQLIRIQLRVPEYGWTTQKVFHLMNFIVNGVRAVVFGCHKFIFSLTPKVLTSLLLDLPGLLFFTTYTLLVLFWAEIYYQARSLPTDKLRTVYISVNAGVYFFQLCIWIYLWADYNDAVVCFGQVFIAVVSFIAALGFLLYGGRQVLPFSLFRELFFMLRRFPIESKGRRKKLREINNLAGRKNVLTSSVAAGWVSHSYLFHMLPHKVAISAFDSDASLRVLDHPILDLIYYTLVEIIPSALVLFILSKLPPKRVSAQRHQIR